MKSNLYFLPLSQSAFMLLFKCLIAIHGITCQDVCMSSARAAWEFYYAVRDALLLYEAIVPVKVLSCGLLEQSIILDVLIFY